MFKRGFFVLFLSAWAVWAMASEGMWLPILLNQLNEPEMKKMGMKMSAADIYSVNKGSLKDAIVSFGGFCTGELISGTGLLLTNHHCGLSAIQSHSSVENNLVDNGFWAKTRADERSNPGLFATFIVRIEEVTAAALAGITEDMNEKTRQFTIEQNIGKIRAAAKRESYQDVNIRPFFHGNQYFLFVTETYTDVRLVGAPPASIGKFGADTDNWVWPRHTGDFSLFRIYAGPDNRPASYSPDNVPLKPRHFLPISLDGVSEGDFTLVMGFPGRTNEYLPAAGVRLQTDVLNPIRIGIRDHSLAIMGEAMKADPKVKIMYIDKQSSLANSWKKWIGESQGIDRTNALSKKKAFEAEFNARVNADPAKKAAYGQVLAKMNELYQKQEPYAKSREYVLEIVNRNVELFQLANTLNQFIQLYDKSGAQALQSRLGRLKDFLADFQANYVPAIDQQIMAELLEIYFNQMAPEHLSPYLVEQVQATGKDFSLLAGTLFEKSALDEPAALASRLDQDLAGAMELIRTDAVYQLVRQMMDTNEKLVLPQYAAIQEELDLLQRKYMKGIMEAFPDRRLYPDANSTLRVTYGQVQGYEPRDGVEYEAFTTLEGVMQKYVPGDYEFDVPERLRELYQTKDYGPYGQNGEMPLCFIGTNHTTGGNSGSPAVDASGNLIGLNFDRAWEGVMSDLYYDPSICRNIMVDIRYVLFIIDKFGGAKHLVDEMTLVRPKKGKK